MSDTSSQTVKLRSWLERMHGGDAAAREELFVHFGNRLERLARKMLGRFPSVRPWAETGDVLQSSIMRLLRALEQVRPTTTREFFGLAAEQMRRELLDLARKYRGSQIGHACRTPDDSFQGQPFEPADLAADPDELEKWYAFHERVEHLPVDEREVVSLVIYHGWSTAQIAELMQTNRRTVQRRWQSALLKLRQTLNGGAD